jgi:lipoic acid synthetase
MDLAETLNPPEVFRELPGRKPEWLRKNLRGDTGKRLADMIGDLMLHTVCREARCPNATECFSARQATFLVLGKNCTRACRFCNVTKSKPEPIDPGEAVRVAEAVRRMDLSFVVITSPTRDDLPDGGARHFAAVLAAIRREKPECKVELLVPDFGGVMESVDIVLASKPDVFSHNAETVSRLYGIRAGADYRRTLSVLARAAKANSVPVKTGLMLGLGETAEEIRALFADLLEAGCRYLSIGQYLRPSLSHTPVAEYIRPEIFGDWKREALAAGFEKVESGPFVRSSYHAANFLSVT